ncbi:hypothetical protein KIPB_005500, partial [Kipferlia bialata]
ETIRHHGNKSDTVCLIDSNVSENGIKVLSSAFTHVVRVSLHEHECNMPRWERFKELYAWLPACFTKLACLRLHPYNKVLFFDADMICLGVVDHAFALNAPAGVMMTRKNAGLPHGSPVPERDLRMSLKGSYGMSGACWLLEPSEEDHKAMLASVDGYGSDKYGDRVLCAGPDEQLVSLHYMNKRAPDAPFTPWTNIGRVFNCVSWQKGDVECGKLRLLDMPRSGPGAQVPQPMPASPSRYSIGEDGTATLLPRTEGETGMDAEEESRERAVRVLHYVTEKPWNADPAAPSREKKQLWPDYKIWYESLERIKAVLGDDASLATPAVVDGAAGVPILPTSWAEDQFVTQADADKAFGKTPNKKTFSNRPRDSFRGRSNNRGRGSGRTPYGGGGTMRGGFRGGDRGSSRGWAAGRERNGEGNQFMPRSPVAKKKFS